MCNLSGYFGKKPNSLKLKLLLATGRERGTDSVGIYKNGDHIREISPSGYNSIKNGDATVFLTQEPDLYKEDWKDGFNLVMQHNRKKSSGLVNKDSVHPYVIPFGENDEHNFVFMHNGTLTNKYQLAAKYGYKATDYSTDSELLANLILFEGRQVLKWYEGTAACVFYYTDSPEEVWFWKGAEVKKSWDTKKAEFSGTYSVEERPLHYIYEDDGIYFSSLTGQLFNISDRTKKEIREGSVENNETVYQVSNNGLICFENGKIKSLEILERETIPRKRTAVQQGVNPNRTDYGTYNNWENHDTIPDSIPRYTSNMKNQESQRIYCNNHKYVHIIKRKAGETIHREAHGVYRVNKLGEVDGDGINTYKYIYKGAIINNRKTFIDICIKKNYSVSPNQVDYKSLLIVGKGKIFLGNTFQKNMIFRPRFGSKYIETDSNGLFVTDYTVEEAIKDGLLNIEQFQIEVYNNWMGTNFCSKFECNSHYKYDFEQKEDICWESEFKGLPFIDTEIHEKYCIWSGEQQKKSNDGTSSKVKAAKKFRKEMQDNLNKTSLNGNTIVKVLPQVDDKSFIRNTLKYFNKQYNTEFTSKEQANTWFLEQYDCQYNATWGIADDYGKENTFDKLPFDDDVSDNDILDTYVNDIEESAEKEMAVDAFEKEYEDLEIQAIDIYNDYKMYEEHFTDEETSTKWKNLSRVHNILSGFITSN